MMNAQRKANKRRTQDRIREMLLSDDTNAGKEYFIESFVTAAMLALSRARREADLTQEEVARQMNTKQPAVARWEADLSGAMSLEHYAQFAAACGVLPFDVTFVPISSLCDYTLANPGAPRTAGAYTAWLSILPAAGNTTQSSGQTTAVVSQSSRHEKTQMTVQGPQQTIQHQQSALAPIQYSAQGKTLQAPSVRIAA